MLMLEIWPLNRRVIWRKSKPSTMQLFRGFVEGSVVGSATSDGPGLEELSEDGALFQAMFVTLRLRNGPSLTMQKLLL